MNLGIYQIGNIIIQKIESFPLTLVYFIAVKYIPRFNGNSNITFKLFYVFVKQRKLGNTLLGDKNFSGNKMRHKYNIKEERL